jgi:hypothetical protein
VTDEDFRTLCLMTAALRAGRFKKLTKEGQDTGKAWAESMSEAANGLALLTRNRGVLDQIVALQTQEPQSIDVPQSAEVTQSTTEAKSEEVAQTT